MLGKIGSLVARVAEEAGSVVGLRFGTEEPRYTSEKVTHGLEIRNYGYRIAAQTTELLDALKDTAFEPTGTPVGWFYDPPWTLPSRRRNEVAVPVARR